MNDQGLVVVLSGPSGVGKGTVLKKLIAENEDVVVSISATTRKPREGEIDGVHYFFITLEQFEEMIRKGDMLEYAVYNGNYYGTPKTCVDSCVAQGLKVVLEIEVEGARQMREKCPNAVFVFVMPPSVQELESRLRGRNTEDEKAVSCRLEIARKEMEQIDMYDFVVYNDTVENAAKQIEEIISQKGEIKA